jgi:hypothetical protein
MAEMIEKRVDDLEHVLAHLPEDLDARFAGVDTKLAAIREVQALHTTRFTTLEQKLNQVASAVAEILRNLPSSVESKWGSTKPSAPSPTCTSLSSAAMAGSTTYLKTSVGAVHGRSSIAANSQTSTPRTSPTSRSRATHS